jgi:hypothetical protein
MKKISRCLTLTLLAVGLMVLSACGGGGSSGSSSSSGGNTLRGTAATGAPIVAGTVTLKDSAGATATTTTDAKGNYSFDVNGKHFPLMLKVQPNTEGAAPLFSAALAWGTANSTPLTTLQVFEATGRTDPSPIYNSGDFSKIGKSSLDYGKSTVTTNFATQFAANGLDLTTHDPITTPMLANGIGMDAILDQTNVVINNGEASLTDLTGKCLNYGPANEVTFAIDGMHPADILGLFGIPPIAFSGVMEDEYIKKSLVGDVVHGMVCTPGIDQPRPIAPNFSNPNVMLSNVIWTRNPSLADTTAAVTMLKNQLEDAHTRNKLAVMRGGVAGPINVVAHSWGTVVAYIALTELARDGSVIDGSPINIATLITMGSPIQCMSGGCGVKSSTVQNNIPPAFVNVAIKKPSNVTTWKNFWSVGDAISGDIPVLNSDSQKPTYACITPPNSIDAIYILDCHNAYWQPPGTLGSVITQIRSLLKSSQADGSSAPITTPAPTSTTPATLPSTSALSVGSPYCDLSTPPGPAVKLTWSASDGAVNYRVFRNDSAIGVNLISSQLSFQNNLGLVAGQTYNYKVQAMNVNGTTWSNTVPVTIPTAVCSSVTPPPAQVSLAVTKNGTGSGTVSSNPAGISCGSSCSANFSGGSVTLTATAAADSTFAGWGGTCTGTGSCNVTMDANKTVTATFNTSSGTPPTSFTLSGTAQCSGSSPQISLSGWSSSGADTFDLYRNGLLYSSSNTGPTFLNTSVTAGTTYSYYVVAKNAYGSTTSNNTVSVTALTCGSTGSPPTSFTLSGSALCSGSSPQISLSGWGSSGADTFDLYRNGSLYSPSNTGPTFTNTSVTAGSTYSYYVVAKNAYGSTTSKTVSVTAQTCGSVGSPPASFTLSGSALCSGSSPQISLSGWGSSGFTTFDLYRDGSLLYPANTGPNFLNTSVTAGVTYSYSVTAKNASGSTSSNTVTVTAPSSCGGAAPLVVNGVASNYIGTGQKTIPLSGSGFNSLSQISWSCTMPNGTTCVSSPYVWSPGTARWSNLTISSDTAAIVYPTFLVATDSPGTYNWSVTFSGAGQSVTKYFTVTK